MIYWFWLFLYAKEVFHYDRKDQNSERPRGERGEKSRGERGERSERGERRQRRDRRSGVSEEQLIAQAQDAAKEVKKWGEPVTLPKMNAHDRRIIHITLENDPELTTVSEGEGALKKVIVSLRKEGESAPKAAEVQE